MTRPFEIDIDPVDVDADGIAEAQTPAAGGVQSLSLDGNLVSGGVFTEAFGGRKLLLTTTADEQARTFTVTGTDPDGLPQTEEITGVDNTTAEGTKYFHTVTGITVDDDTADAVSFGTVDEIASKTIPLDWRSDDPAYLYADIAGTINFTVQETYDDIKNYAPGLGSLQARVDWVNISDLTTKTADTAGVARVNATALRILISSYSSGAEIQLKVGQSSFA